MFFYFFVQKRILDVVLIFAFEFLQISLVRVFCAPRLRACNTRRSVASTKGEEMLLFSVQRNMQ